MGEAHSRATEGIDPSSYGGQNVHRKQILKHCRLVVGVIEAWISQYSGLWAG